MSSEHITSRDAVDVDGIAHSECPDGQHRWMVVREYHGRDCFSVTGIDVRTDGIRVTADSVVDSDEIVEVHRERLLCSDCPAECSDIASVEYR